ncbi:hypothetical protein MOX02_39270 [Methylobacterium oxalidis]|uniref:Uncharacterized protein n=1 Tax=Methylobacterium oxalidis TaxID=944322 RepID=A0A512J7N2_9HYPH|nr:hypothetical protein MOX02_39270 [Methylobacterium oxalidis]GLS61656.1 hypothetical protein GCM10007888_00370 [Methylobacterium oxalidis]
MVADAPLGLIAQSGAGPPRAARVARHIFSARVVEAAPSRTGPTIILHSQVPLTPSVGAAAIVLRLDIRHGCSSNAVTHNRFRVPGTESGEPRWGGGYQKNGKAQGI